MNFANAACRGVDTNLFYPTPRDDGRVEYDWETIRECCTTCPVHQPCFEYALEREEQGCWAATTPSFRRKLRRKLRIKVNPVGVELPEWKS